MDLGEAKVLALALIKEHCPDYGFAFDSAVRRFGCCHWLTKTITISKHLTQLNDASAFRQIMLHEIAHAITHEHHTRVWLRTARAIGYTGGRCYADSTKTPPKQYTYICDNCKTTIQRHRQAFRLACASCCAKYNGGKFSEKYLIHKVG